MADLIYPDGPEDHDGIVAYTQRITETQSAHHHELERQALRNILYYLGYQWITYEQSQRLYRPMGLKKGVPRPVTNKIAPMVNTATSNLVAYRVPLTYASRSSDAGAVAAAHAADAINQIIEKEVDRRSLARLTALWMLLTGSTFLVSQYDTSLETGIETIRQLQCPQCGTLTTPMELADNGACQSCEFDQPDQFLQAVDSTGSPMDLTYGRGKFYTEVENVFSTWVDPEAVSFKESAYVLISRTRSKDWVARTYGEELAESLTYGVYEDPYSTYLDSLAYATSRGITAGGASSATDSKCKIQRVWIRPRQDKAPEGIYAVVAGQTVIESGPWPYHDDEGKPLLNITHIPCDIVPGRVVGKTRVDDLIPKQDQRNRVEAIIELHSQRMANAVWLIPEGSGLSRITGEQGMIMRYNALANVPPPTRLQGDNPPPYLLQWLSIIDGDMDAIFGLYDIGRGEAPFKGASYAAMQLLDERQQQGQTAILENWSLGWMDWAKINLYIWREYANGERVLSSEIGPWAMEKFSRASLQGGIIIDVEIGQNRPRTTIGRRAAYEQAARLGLVNIMNPQEKYAGLKLLGIPEIMPDYKLDKENAARENDIFVTGPEPPEAPKPWDNHAVHLEEHRNLILSEKFSLLPPEMQQTAHAHVMIHFQFQTQMSMQSGVGNMAPKPPIGNAKGTAKEGASSGDAEETPDQSLLDQETQNASPDVGGGGF